MAARKSSTSATRQRILEAAKVLFIRNGLAGVTMEAVAAEAGFSKMTIYRHFGNRDAFLAGVVKLLCRNLQAGTASPTDSPGSIEAVLRDFGQRFLDTIFNPETVELNRLAIAESRRHPALARMYYRLGPQASIAALAKRLAPFSETGLLHGQSPRQVAEDYLDLLRGYAHQRLLLNVTARIGPAERRRRIDNAIKRVLK